MKEPSQWTLHDWLTVDHHGFKMGFGGTSKVHLAEQFIFGGDCCKHTKPTFLKLITEYEALRDTFGKDIHLQVQNTQVNYGRESMGQKGL